METHPGRPPISKLMKPIYVIQMNWSRWPDATRARWLKTLRQALIETLGAVNHELKRLGEVQEETAPESFKELAG